MKKVTIGVIVTIVLIVVFLTMHIGVQQCINDKVDTIETIDNANDSIKANVKYLDSIKDAKAVEVEMLDNDSTVKLFYQLIK